MSSYTYSNDRRHDPEVRDKVERVIRAQNALMLKAARQLKETLDEMRELSGIKDRASLFDRSYDAVYSAYWRVDHDATFMNRDGGPNDCYIGNMAAGEMGEYLEGIDLDARFGGKV